MSASTFVSFVRSTDHDWLSVYVNGTKVHEGHDIRPEELLAALRIPFNRHELDAETYPDTWPVPKA